MSAMPKKQYVKQRVKQTYPGYPAVTSVWQDPILEAMPDAPVEAPDSRSIDELMVAATTPAGVATEGLLGASEAPREAFYGYIPDAPARSLGEEHETAAQLSLAKNIMAMGGLQGGTDPEAYLKARLAERARYEEALQNYNMNKEQTDPMSATSQAQQRYLKGMGVDASGLGTAGIAAVGAPQRASNLELKNKDIEFGLTKAQIDANAKLAAAKARKGGGGGGGAKTVVPYLKPDGAIDWNHPEAMDALQKAGGNRFTAEKFLRDPKFRDKAELKYFGEVGKNPDQLRTQTIKYGEGLKDYNDLDRIVGQLEGTFQKYTSKGARVPGVGAVGILDKPVAWLAQNFGVDTPEGRDAQAIARLQAEAKQIYQRIKTGLHAGEREMVENMMITATSQMSTPRQVMDAIAGLRSYVTGGKSNLAASFGPEVVAQYEANRTATAAQTPPAAPAPQAASGKITLIQNATGQTITLDAATARHVLSDPAMAKKYSVGK